MSLVPGPQGEPGILGPQGPQGVDGKRGLDSVGPPGAPGAPGLTTFWSETNPSVTFQDVVLQGPIFGSPLFGGQNSLSVTFGSLGFPIGVAKVVGPNLEYGYVFQRLFMTVGTTAGFTAPIPYGTTSFSPTVVMTIAVITDGRPGVSAPVPGETFRVWNYASTANEPPVNQIVFEVGETGTFTKTAGMTTVTFTAHAGGGGGGGGGGYLSSLGDYSGGGGGGSGAGGEDVRDVDISAFPDGSQIIVTAVGAGGAGGAPGGGGGGAGTDGTAGGATTVDVFNAGTLVTTPYVLAGGGGGIAGGTGTVEDGAAGGAGFYGGGGGGAAERNTVLGTDGAAGASGNGFGFVALPGSSGNGGKGSGNLVANAIEGAVGGVIDAATSGLNHNGGGGGGGGGNGAGEGGNGAVWSAAGVPQASTAGSVPNSAGAGGGGGGGGAVRNALVSPNFILGSAGGAGGGGRVVITFS